MEEYLACSKEHSIITHYALLPQEPIMTCLDLFLDQKPSQTKQAPYGESEAGQDQHHKKLESHQQREDNCLIHLP